MAHYGNSVNEFFISRVREVYRKRKAVIDNISTAAQAQEYVESVRVKWQKIFQFPENRCPLDPRITGIEHFPGYTVEKLYFYSRPGFPVTANLYLPEKFSGKLPGVLFMCGHNREGKGTGPYRRACVGLALKGFACLIIDPVEQGERRQYRQFKFPVLRSLCGNHNLMGRHLAVNGEWLGSWRAYDGVRALDYLESRPEIDPSQLIITGQSGGGTLTALVAACDPRPAAAIPCCYISSWKANIENELPVDIEQIPPLALKYGLEMADLLLAYPRHNLIIGQIDDVFDHRGTLDSFETVKKINSLLGKDTQVFIGPYPHSYHLEDREESYKFLTRHFKEAISSKEPDFELPDLQTTLVCNDEISTIPGNRFIHEIAAETAAKIAAERKVLNKAETAAAVREFFHIPEKIEMPAYRILRCICQKNDNVASRFALETETDRIMAILYRLDLVRDFYHIPPAKNSGRATLIIPHLSALAETYEREIIPGEDLYALDMRTIGALMPDGTDQIGRAHV